MKERDKEINDKTFKYERKQRDRIRPRNLYFSDFIFIVRTRQIDVNESRGLSKQEFLRKGYSPESRNNSASSSKMSTVDSPSRPSNADDVVEDERIFAEIP